MEVGTRETSSLEKNTALDISGSLMADNTSESLGKTGFKVEVPRSSLMVQLMRANGLISWYIYCKFR